MEGQRFRRLRHLFFVADSVAVDPNRECYKNTSQKKTSPPKGLISFGSSAIFNLKIRRFPSPPLTEGLALSGLFRCC